MGNQIEKAKVSGTSIFSLKSENSLGLLAPSRNNPNEEASQIRGAAMRLAACLKPSCKVEGGGAVCLLVIMSVRANLKIEPKIHVNDALYDVVI